MFIKDNLFVGVIKMELTVISSQSGRLSPLRLKKLSAIALGSSYHLYSISFGVQYRRVYDICMALRNEYVDYGNHVV